MPRWPAWHDPNAEEPTTRYPNVIRNFPATATKDGSASGASLPLPPYIFAIARKNGSLFSGNY
jgi:hypothetical protein